AQQLGDTVDRGHERVLQRELRDRLADDRDERPAAFELDRLLTGTLARAQRMRRACRERRQRVENIVGRNRRPFEAELESADRRLAELQDPRAGRHRERRPAGERAGDLVLVGIVDAEAADDPWPHVVVEPPDERAAGRRRLSRQPGNLLGGPPAGAAGAHQSGRRPAAARGRRSPFPPSPASATAACSAARPPYARSSAETAPARRRNSSRPSSWSAVAIGNSTETASPSR